MKKPLYSGKPQYIHVRISEREKDILFDCAAQDQMTENPNVSTYVRKLIRKPGQQITDELAEAMHGLENQFIRIGNNINQIARSANAGLITEDQKKHLMEYMEELIWNQKRFMTEIYKKRLGETDSRDAHMEGSEEFPG